MKKIFFTLWFLSVLTTAWADRIEYVTRIEIVTEEVCPAMSGCWLDTLTGECPDCVLETREIVHKDAVLIKEPEVVKSTPVPVKEKRNTGKWVCVVGPCDFIDENGNLKTNG